MCNITESVMHYYCVNCLQNGAANCSPKARYISDTNLILKQTIDCLQLNSSTGVIVSYSSVYRYR